MPHIKYEEKTFRATTLALVKTVNQIVEEYRVQGYDLTLRQVYYQCVSRDIIPNNEKSYDKLGRIVGDARMAGLIDWKAIVDRTRALRGNTHWRAPAEIMSAAAKSFAVDKWSKEYGQDFRPEVWVEKDALVGVVGRVCEELDVNYFSCRGYTSLSEMWTASQRLLKYRGQGQTPFVIHLGDHDPSGMDMSRDITDRLEVFTRRSLEFERLALNTEQVQQYNPPPNPAKLSDSRATGYIARFGYESWELDALNPQVIADLIRRAVVSCRHDEAWEQAVKYEKGHIKELTAAAKHWQTHVVPAIRGLK
ncbi:MAG: hypothetical protein H0T45_10145 [Pyrinomonadaceae bacterium]|nr:hypothetical protein [Pyrinomonadaceae bacterium]MDQ3258305.1 hypothetical protein [Acidobacteriota bacterium]